MLKGNISCKKTDEPRGGSPDLSRATRRGRRNGSNRILIPSGECGEVGRGGERFLGDGVSGGTTEASIARPLTLDTQKLWGLVGVFGGGGFLQEATSQRSGHQAKGEGKKTGNPTG